MNSVESSIKKFTMSKTSVIMLSRRLSCPESCWFRTRPGSYVVRGCPEPNVVLGLFTILFRPVRRNFLPAKVITSAGSVGGPEFLDRPIECLGDFLFYLDNFSVVIYRLRYNGIPNKLPRYATVSRNIRIPNIFFKKFNPDF